MAGLLVCNQLKTCCLLLGKESLLPVWKKGLTAGHFVCNCGHWLKYFHMLGRNPVLWNGELWKCSDWLSSFCWASRMIWFEPSSSDFVGKNGKGQFWLPSHILAMLEAIRFPRLMDICCKTSSFDRLVLDSDSSDFSSSSTIVLAGLVGIEMVKTSCNLKTTSNGSTDGCINQWRIQKGMYSCIAIVWAGHALPCHDAPIAVLSTFLELCLVFASLPQGLLLQQCFVAVTDAGHATWTGGTGWHPLR